jgi:HEAT repeat protein
VTRKQIWLNLAALGVLIALLGLIYWQHTGARAVPGLLDDLQSGDVQRQVLAAEALKAVGPAAMTAIEPLVAAATSPNSSLSMAAAGALPAIELGAARSVMHTWLSKLNDPDVQMRRDAVSALGALGPVAKPAVGLLVAALNDPDLLVRERATRAVGSIGIPYETVLQGLSQALTDSEWTVRYAAVTQFSFNGHSSPAALTLLQALTKDENKTVAQMAQSAVASIQRPIQVSTYLVMLRQGMNRTYALQQLAKLGPRAAEATEEIAALFGSEIPLERYLAACALAEIGPAAKQALPRLQRAIQDPDPIVRATAAEATNAVEKGRSA